MMCAGEFYLIRSEHEFNKRGERACSPAGKGEARRGVGLTPSTAVSMTQMLTNADQIREQGPVDRCTYIHVHVVWESTCRVGNIECK